MFGTFGDLRIESPHRGLYLRISQTHKIGNIDINANFVFQYMHFSSLFAPCYVSKCELVDSGCKRIIFYGCIPH